MVTVEDAEGCECYNFTWKGALNFYGVSAVNLGECFHSVAWGSSATLYMVWPSPTIHPLPTPAAVAAAAAALATAARVCSSTGVQVAAASVYPCSR